MLRTILITTTALAFVACANEKAETVASKSAVSQPAEPKAEAKAEAKPASKPTEGLPAAPARQDDATRSSKNGKLEATVGGVLLSVQYGRPTVKGRKIFGDLVRYDKVWRTGADEATTISFASAAMFGGQKVERGTYALFMVPSEKGWQVILNSEPKQWGAYKHDASKDVLKADVEAKKHDNTEALTFAATDSAVQLMWADVVVTVPVSAAK